MELTEFTELVNDVESRIASLLKECDGLHARASVLINSYRKLQLENEQYRKKLSVIAGIVSKGEET
jgi:regulator of replication initiation timing